MVGCVVLFYAVTGFAKQDDNDIQFVREQVSSRKEPGFFTRPAKDTAGEQIKYAEKLRVDGALRKAEKAYRALVHEWHDSPEAAEAQLKYAEILLERHKYRKAFDEYQYMVEYFAGQFDYNAVLDSQFKIANQIMTMKHGQFLFFPGFLSPDRALPLLETIVANGPDWHNTPQTQFNIGLIQEQAGSYNEAVEAYELVRSRYSQSDYAAGASFRRAHCMNEISKKLPRDEMLCRRALMAVSGFLREYTGDPNEEVAKQYEEDLKSRLANMYYEIAVFYDTKAHKPSSAIIAYSDFIKHFPSSDKAVEADKRRAELEKEIEDGE